MEQVEIYDFWRKEIDRVGFKPQFMHTMLEHYRYFIGLARSAPFQAKPLVLYYAILNFSKLRLNIERKYGNTFEYKHGISEKNMGHFHKSYIEVHAIANKHYNVSAELFGLLDGLDIPRKQPLRFDMLPLLQDVMGLAQHYPGYSDRFKFFNAMYFFGSMSRYHPYFFAEQYSEEEIALLAQFLEIKPYEYIQELTNQYRKQSL